MHVNIFLVYYYLFFILISFFVIAIIAELNALVIF